LNATSDLACILPRWRIAISLFLALLIAPHHGAARSIEPMDLVVRGQVVAVEVSQRTPAWVSMRDEIPVKQRAEYVDRHYRITLIVDAVERGALQPETKQIAFSGWCVLRRPADRPATRQPCHEPVPARGDALRVHLKVGIGRLVMSPAGYELLRN
jgi:hypothetical protein